MLQTYTRVLTRIECQLKAASSRATPFNKMAKEVELVLFSYAWQKKSIKVCKVMNIYRNGRYCWIENGLKARI
jgi:hypothetical protein